MIVVDFPATTHNDFPRNVHPLLEKADRGVFYFPGADELEAPTLDEFNSNEEALVRLAYFNYWLAALRVYYTNAAWSYIFSRLGAEPIKVLGKQYADVCTKIDSDFQEAVKGLFEHYGYDYQGSPARRMV